MTDPMQPDPQEVLAQALVPDGRNDAADLLAALSDAGFVIVPREDLRLVCEEFGWEQFSGESGNACNRLQAVLEGGENE